MSSNFLLPLSSSSEVFFSTSISASFPDTLSVISFLTLASMAEMSEAFMCSCVIVAVAKEADPCVGVLVTGDEIGFVGGYPGKPVTGG